MNILSWETSVSSRENHWSGNSGINNYKGSLISLQLRNKTKEPNGAFVKTLSWWNLNKVLHSSELFLFLKNNNDWGIEGLLHNDWKSCARNYFRHEVCKYSEDIVILTVFQPSCERRVLTWELRLLSHKTFESLSSTVPLVLLLNSETVSTWLIRSTSQDYNWSSKG